MAHEEKNDPVAQSTSKSPTTSTADLSERDNKEIPVVKEEETNDTEVFEEVVVEVARLPRESKSSRFPVPIEFLFYLTFHVIFPLLLLLEPWIKGTKPRNELLCAGRAGGGAVGINSD